MSSDLLIGLIGALGGFLGGIAAFYIAVRMLKPNIKVQESLATVNETQADVNRSVVVKNIAEALTDALEFSETERKELRGRVDELESHRELRAQQIEDLGKQIEKLNIEYTREITNLRDQVQTWEERYSELETKYSNSKKAIELLAQALRDRGIDMPPGLEVLLGDSIAKLKLPKAGQ